MKTAPIVLALALSLGAFACGPGAQQPPAGSTPDTTRQEAQPKSGGVLTTFMLSDPNDWDMRTQGKTGVNVETHGLVYETLLRFKHGPDVDYAAQILEPRLAERWEVSADAKTFTFHLRKGVKFQDLPPVNGRELTSADVKWSMEYYSAREFQGKKLPTSQVEFMYDGLDRVETPDPSTVAVRFKEPYAPFIYYAASQWMPVAAHEVYEQNGSLTDTLIGSGPFLFDQAATQKGTAWVLKKNPRYWDPGKPYLDGIKKLILPEIATQQAAFQTRQLDIMAPVRLNEVAQAVQKANPQAAMDRYLIPIGNALLVSQKRNNALTDVRVRRAISLALDREEHSKVLYGGEGAPYLAGSWPGLFTEAEQKEMLKYDPEQAKRLLAEAGVSNPSFEMILCTCDSDNTQQQLIQAQLKKAGIDVKFTMLAREQHRPRLYAGDYDFYRNSGGGLLEADADSFLFGEFYSKSSLNWSGINDPELDEYLLATRREADPAKRKEAMRAAARRINDQAYDPGIVYPANWSFAQPYVRNFRMHFTSGEREAWVWLDK